MPVPYTFANATVSIPLSQLDNNFATAITLGNTAIQLGNTVTTLNNMTFANVTISSGTVNITNVVATNANVTTANVTNLISGNAVFSGGNVVAAVPNATITNALLANNSATIGNTVVELGNTVTSIGNLTLANVTISSGTANVSNATVTDTLDLSGTGAAQMNVGTTAQRPGTPSEGMFRYNSDNNKFEGYINGSWGSVGGGATGGGSDQIFIENGQTVTTNYTITTNFNAGSFGPVSVNSGVTVTIPTGSVWTIV